MNILYLTYDSIFDPIGKSQILPYLKNLSKNNLISKIVLVSFDKKNPLITARNKSELKKELKDHNILWISLLYHKHPNIISTFYDIINGLIKTLNLSIMHKIDVIHARSYVPAVIALFIKFFLRKLFIFDMRGFWADERIEGGIWKKGLIYRMTKLLEKAFLIISDAVVVLTYSAKEELISTIFKNIEISKITVIPTSVDLYLFNINKDRPICNNEFTFVYTGSLGTWYNLDEMICFFKRMQVINPLSKLLIISKQFQLALNKIEKSNLTNVNIISSDYSTIPQYLNKSCVGLAFYKPGFSRKGCSPVKVGEYLACGIPVIINKNIGDIDRIIENERVGAVLDNFSESEYVKSFMKIKELYINPGDIALKCRNTAERYFDFNKNTKKYIEVYKKICSNIK